MGAGDRSPKTDVRQRRAFGSIEARLAALEAGGDPDPPDGETTTPVAGEIPDGAINGVNSTFTLAHTPAAGTLKLYRNGLKMRAGGGNDYTLAANTITFTDDARPEAGSVIEADYRWA